MKIVMVTNTYGPSVNGVVRSIESFVTEFRRRGHRVLVVAPEGDGVEQDPEVLRLPALRELETEDFSVSIPIPSAYLERLDDFRPDIVHTHHPFLLGAAAVRIASRYEIPLIFTSHAIYEDREPVPGDSPLLRRFAAELAIGYANLADTVIAPSDSISAILQNRGVASPIQVIPSGIDVERFETGTGSAFRQQFNIPAGAFVIGYVGRLTAEKSVGFLAKAVGSVMSEHPEMWFVAVGDGSAREAMREEFTRRAVQHRVCFTGTLEPGATPGAYAAFDVFAYASQSETQAIPVLEAMAASVPIVAIDAPGVREFVQNGKNGLLVAHPSRRLFANGLETIRSATPEQRRQWGLQGRETASDFTTERCASRMLHLYEHLSRLAPRPRNDEFEAWELSRRRLDAEWNLWTNRLRATGHALTDGLHPARVPVLRHVFHGWRRFRRWFSRREWSVKLLNLPVSNGTADEPGLIILQIDGLSRAQLDHALRAGRLPFLRRLLKREHYHLHTMYSGQPATTPAVLGELFFGVEQAVPSFGFRDHRTGHVVQMFQPGIAYRVQQELAQQGEGLLAGGSAYCDIYSGGAAESSFCPATTGWRNLEDVTMWRRIALFLMNIMSLVRIACLSVVELLVALGDFARGVARGYEFWRELIYVPRRLIVNIVLRELVAIGAEVDATRGVRVLHANFLGYDENAHRRGPDALFAHYALRGIDRSIRRIWNAAHASHRRNYRVWIIADHGQEGVIPYVHAYGCEIGEAIRDVYAGQLNGRNAPEKLAKKQDGPHGVEPHRARWLRRSLTWHHDEHAESPEEQQVASRTEPVTVAIGPLGHVYWPSELSDHDREQIAPKLVAEAHVPLVLAKLSDGSVCAWTRNGRFRLPEHADRLLSENHPHLNAVAKDLTKLCHHPDAGDLLILGWRNEGRPLSFVAENGAHGGPGPNETSGFALLSADALVPRDGNPFRPSTLRQCAQTLLSRGPLGRPRPENRGRQRGLRLVTYNVHSCIGLDGRLSPSRIARVLARTDPDVVALQELDVARGRSNFIHQAEEIARALEMELHFHPSFEVEDERYGNAILSRLPMRLVKASGLPQTHRAAEPRGAIWVEVELLGTQLQVITTHLGLNPAERRAQVDELLGPEWLAHPHCHPPVILCGDFNAGPRSQSYRRLAGRLHDVQRDRSAKRTWFAPLPLTRIDHVFVSPELQVEHVEVPRNTLSKVASDHLPLLVDIRLPESADAAECAAAGRRDPTVESASLNSP